MIWILRGKYSLIGAWTSKKKLVKYLKTITYLWASKCDMTDREIIEERYTVLCFQDDSGVIVPWEELK